MRYTDWEYKLYMDPALSILLVILILHSVWPLLRESALILLQTVPTHIQVDAIQRRLLEKVDGVLAVHEFHVWQLAGDRIIASAHIRCRNLSEYMKIAEKVKEFFHHEGIHSTTIQPEFVEIEAMNSYSGESSIYSLRFIWHEVIASNTFTSQVPTVSRTAWTVVERKIVVL